ncbi:MAG TPA: HIT family hydrolase [Bacteroidetes bacterium]|jgi:ATP adenylyltransferase|nr:HIT family hydrolase [Bacteroidota bacterium]
MHQMWSPWRSTYIDTFKKPAKKKRRGESIFTAALEANDDDGQFIVWRGKHCFVIMNRYPYNSGHLMIVPYRKTGRFEDIRGEEFVEIMATTQRAKKALDKVMKPQGYNFGANIGRAAGAGVDNHIHFHIVPRWNGDTNLMPVLANTKIISEDMRATLKKLRKAF